MTQNPRGLAAHIAVQQSPTPIGYFWGERPEAYRAPPKPMPQRLRYQLSRSREPNPCGAPAELAHTSTLWEPKTT